MCRRSDNGSRTENHLTNPIARTVLTTEPFVQTQHACFQWDRIEDRVEHENRYDNEQKIHKEALTFCSQSMEQWLYISHVRRWPSHKAIEGQHVGGREVKMNPSKSSKYSPISVAHLSVVAALLRGYVLHDIRKENVNCAAQSFSFRENLFRWEKHVYK